MIFAFYAVNNQHVDETVLKAQSDQHVCCSLAVIIRFPCNYIVFSLLRTGNVYGRNF